VKILFYCGIHNLANFSRLRPYYDRCFGFDANPDKIQAARQAYRNDPNVTFVFGALTEQDGGELSFTITTDWDPASSLGTPNPEYVHTKSGRLKAQRKITVPTVNLQDFCTRHNISTIDTLVTDLQGMDVTVLKTMGGMIVRGAIREIQSEVEPDSTPPIYLGIPSNKLRDFQQLLSDNYDLLWTATEGGSAEDAWEMDARWRVKGGFPPDNLEFIMQNGALTTRLAASAKLESYSQYGEDVVIDALLSHKQNGFYVDVGANDPDALSNSKLLYGRGWRGINIEPDPTLHAKLSEKRPRDLNLNIGIGPNPGIMTFFRMSADTLSSFNREVAVRNGHLYNATLLSEEQVQVQRLTAIFESHLRGNTIDFLSVDAEGYDLEVLKSNDWTRFRPSVLMVEINVGGDEIVRYMERQNYYLVFDNGTNGVFLSREFCASLDGTVLEELAMLERCYSLKTTIPVRAAAAKVTVNVVYGHLRNEDVHEVHRGNVSIVWSSTPLEGCDHYVYHNAFSFRGKQPGLNILLMLEPVVVLPGEFDERVWRHFDYVLTLFDALPERGEKFKKIFFPHFLGRSYAPLTEDLATRRSFYPTAGRRNAICMINGYKQSSVPGELYSRRVEIAQWFHEHSAFPFDVYGNPPFPLPNYRGALAVNAKLATLKQYRYCLCFENTDHPVLSAGYVTEKILDCLETRTIPIYLGASNIEKYIPAECFIDYRKFAGFRELDEFLHSLSDERYEKYIAAMDAFVADGGLKKFTSSSLNRAILDLLVETNLIDPDRVSGNDDPWIPETRLSLQQGRWSGSAAPVLWTWSYLQKADSPLLSPKPVDGEQLNSIAPCMSKVSLLSRTKSIDVLYVGLKYAGGSAVRGYDPSWWNIHDALKHFTNVRVSHFDYMLDAGKNGIAGMSENLVALVKKNKFDVLILNQNPLSADALREAITAISQQTDTVTLGWMSDDHRTFDDRSTLWAPCLDYIVTTHAAAVSGYQQMGFTDKIIKSQWACNPYAIFPMPITQRHNISFVGTAKDDRAAVISSLRDRGLDLEVFGWNWPGGMDIPVRDMIRIFSASRVNLNITSLASTALQHISARTFEVPGCGGFLITTPAEDLERYYIPDKEIVVASSIEELADKARYYLSHDSEREAIARRGYELTIREHTWSRRLTDIFNSLGFSAVAGPPPEEVPVPAHLAVETFDAAPAFRETVLPLLKPTIEDDRPVSIIVTCYNQLQFTKQCIASILHYTKGSYELLLIDNGSTDGTSDFFESVRHFHSRTRIIRSFNNRVVESVGNYAVSLASGKYIVTVTNDTLVHEGWLESFIRQVDSAPDIGMVGPLSNNISGPQKVQAGYDSLEAYQTFAADWCVQHSGEHFPLSRLVGVALITKKSVFERVGGWDPDLPTNGRDGGYGFSDDDFSLRFRLAGYSSLVAKDVFIHHFGSVTSSKYRPDLFGPSQNINKDKYWQKLRRNPRVSIDNRGEVSIMPYALNESAPVEEKTIIRHPRICIVMMNGSESPLMNVQNPYTALEKEFPSVEFAEPAGDLASWLLSTGLENTYDVALVLDTRLAPTFETIRSLLDTALCHPDVAVLVPVGDYAPSTHAKPSTDGATVTLIPYADLSLCVIHLRLVRPSLKPLLKTAQKDDLLWFLQRRTRGDSYFIAKANKLLVISGRASESHPYDACILPEQLVLDKKRAEAAAIYTEDLLRDPSFVESWYRLACIHHEEGKTTEALREIERALKIDPDYIDLHVFLSRYYLTKGSLSQAEQYVRLANLKQPGNPAVRQVVAEFERLKSESGVVSTPLAHDRESQKARVSGLVSIVIRFSRELGTAKKCYHAVKKHAGGSREIIAVVPGTAIPVVKWARKMAQENHSFKFRVTGDERSFSAENNLGIQESSGEYLLLLDDSVLLTQGSLTGMLDCLNSTPSAGIIGPMSDGSSGPQNVQLQDCTTTDLLEKFAKDFQARRRHCRVVVESVSGLCMLFTSELARRVGLFDQNLEPDDIATKDYCLRAALTGFTNSIAGDAFVHGTHAAKALTGSQALQEKWKALDLRSVEGQKFIAVKAIEKARELFGKDLIDQSITELMDGIARASGEKSLYVCLAEMMIEAKRFQDALDAIRATPGEAQGEVESILLSGYAQEGLGRLAEASACADRVLERTSGSGPAFNLKGLVAYKKGDRMAAEKFFTQAVEADPGYGEPYTNLGFLKWAAGQQEVALDLFEKGCILSPATPDIISAYHSAVAATGAFARAEKILRDAKGLHPRNRRIAFLLIDVLIRQEKYDLAMQEIEQAMVLTGIDDGILAAALELRSKIGQGVQPAGGAAPSISLCMIVKNEERHLAKCLLSVKPIVQEMIVVDTGSTDRTRDIATALGASLYDFPWTSDFSAARNFSLSKASGDWILVMDADEVLSDQDYGFFEELLRNPAPASIAYVLNTRNYTTVVGLEGWSPNDDRYSRESAGCGWVPSAKVRLFPRDESIRFENPVHEIVEPSILKKGLTVKSCDVPVHHYGRLDQEKLLTKHEHYYALGKKKLEAKGNDPKALRELAIQAAELQRYEEALALWKRVIELTPQESLAYYNMGSIYLVLGKYGEALSVSKRAVELAPGRKEAVTNYATSELLAGEVSNAETVLRALEKVRPNFPIALALLAAISFIRGDNMGAQRYFDKLGVMNFNVLPFVLDTAKRLVASDRTDSALKFLDGAMKCGYTDRDIARLKNECEGRLVSDRS
jgi:FkbM family methyltransferase